MGEVPPTRAGFGLEGVDGTSVRAPPAPILKAVILFEPLFATYTKALFGDTVTALGVMPADEYGDTATDVNAPVDVFIVKACTPLLAVTYAKDPLGDTASEVGAAGGANETVPAATNAPVPLIVYVDTLLDPELAT